MSALMILPGYYRFQTLSQDVYECPTALDCIGGNRTGSDLCSLASMGPLCSACAPNHYVRDAINSCTVCGDVDDKWWLGPSIIAAVIGSVATLAYLKRQVITEYVDANAHWVFESSTDISARATALFINMQIIVM